MGKISQIKSGLNELVLSAIINEYWERKRTAGLRQKEFAVELGIAIGTMNRIINGKYIRQETLDRLKNYLDNKAVS